MKVLYIGYYREHSDWSESAINNMLALEKAGCDVVARCIEFSKGETPNEIKHLENKDLEGVEYCIQHVFPHHMIGTNKFKKNVGYFCNEHVDIQHSTWVEKLELMDEVWTPTGSVGVKMPHAVSHEKFSNNYSGMSVPALDATFKFYNIVNTNSLPSVIKAFHSEFSTFEPVNLILQVDSFQQDQELHNTLESKITDIKTGLGLQPDPRMYKRDFISTSWASPLSKFQLHDYADCYISNNNPSITSHDIEAVAFGNTPLVASLNPIVDIFDSVQKINSIYVSKSRSESSLFRDMNNSLDFSISVCERDLRQKMRDTYEKWKQDPMTSIENRKNGINAVAELSLEKTGEKMKEALSV
jgi:hypothetical protein|tara:strand:+ start:3145 stop:4212 length:1068 start_codon:yes stop_codon:yes gene_type:complete